MKYAPLCTYLQALFTSDKQILAKLPENSLFSMCVAASANGVNREHVPIVAVIVSMCAASAVYAFQFFSRW